MGGELWLPGFCVRLISGLLGRTWHNRSGCSCPHLLAPRRVWDIKCCGTLWKPSVAASPKAALRENRELLSLRALSQIAVVISGWQVLQLQRDWTLLSALV